MNPHFSAIPAIPELLLGLPTLLLAAAVWLCWSAVRRARGLRTTRAAASGRPAAPGRRPVRAPFGDFSAGRGRPAPCSVPWIVN
ncbi:MAG TPA: hypothetical protein PK280_05200 [Planctomycetota bacterium]|nr:hypothetical protein [Planctomycetota bacterium]